MYVRPTDAISPFSEWEQLNELKPIWVRPKEEINETEYNSFYKSLSKDYQDPLAYIHFTAEGEVNFNVGNEAQAGYHTRYEDPM